MLSQLRRPPRGRQAFGPAAADALHADRGQSEAGGAAGAAAVADTLIRAALFWSDEWAVDAAAPSQTTGAQVASAAWTQAISRHSRIPYIDIFAPFGSQDMCRQQIQGGMCGAQGPSAPNVGFPLQSELPGLLGARSYDVLHDPGTDLLTGTYAREFFAHEIFPVTCSQHGISYSFQLHSLFVPLLTAQIYPCDAIVCLSRAARTAMANRLGHIAEQYSRVWGGVAPGPPRLDIIPWGVDTQLFVPHEPALARRVLNLPPDRPVVLCLGRVRIEDKMDWTPLLLAFDRVARASKQRPLFVLAGSTFSNYSDHVLAQAAQLGLSRDVRTFFNLPAACIPFLYAACDVFVSPADSVSECFGLSIIEAMACGRPVVASDWNGYRELVSDGETGFTVRTDWADCLGAMEEMAPLLPWGQHHLHLGQSVSVDVALIARRVSELLENPDLRMAMGRTARQRTLELYDWSVIVDRWEQLWQELRAVARTLAPAGARRPGHLQPNNFAHFRHYASRVIDDDALVYLTPRGRAHIAGRPSLLPHPWTGNFLRPEHLWPILSALRPQRWIRTGMPVGKLLEIVRRHRGLSRDQALMHLMWLAKYDLVSFSDGATLDG